MKRLLVVLVLMGGVYALSLPELSDPTVGIISWNLQSDLIPGEAPNTSSSINWEPTLQENEDIERGGWGDLFGGIRRDTHTPFLETAKEHRMERIGDACDPDVARAAQHTAFGGGLGGAYDPRTPLVRRYKCE
jgi:hypothetical protein